MASRFYQKFSLLKSTAPILLRQERNQSQTIKINRHAPAVPQCLELETGLRTRCPRHDDIALLTQGITLLPEHFTHTAGCIPDIHPGTHFKQPYRQTTTQARWNVFSNNHDHCHIYCVR